MTNAATYPVRLEVERAIDGRNRLTTAFRLILAIPHLILVGGPIAGALMWSGDPESDGGSSMGGGILGVAAGFCAIIAWFAILFTGRYPEPLWNFAAFYLRWRVRAVAYSALLRDEYPPFGEGLYPATLEIRKPAGDRDRLTVAFRIILVIPHLIVVALLGIGWAVTSIIAWFAILLTGSYPTGLYDFALGVFRWSARVEAYLLLLVDEYPPFSFD